MRVGVAGQYSNLPGILASRPACRWWPFQTGRFRHRRPAWAHRERFLARRDGSMTSKMMSRASGHHAARPASINRLRHGSLTMRHCKGRLHLSPESQVRLMWRLSPCPWLCPVSCWVQPRRERPHRLSHQQSCLPSQPPHLRRRQECQRLRQVRNLRIWRAPSPTQSS